MTRAAHRGEAWISTPEAATGWNQGSSSCNWLGEGDVPRENAAEPGDD